MTRRRTILLASPYGQTGGGMGSIMTYLAAAPGGPADRYILKRIETRGGGHILRSPLHLARAVGHVVQEAVAGRLALVHLNLAEGGSVYRKAIIMAATKLCGGRVLLHLHAARIRQFHDSVNGLGKWVTRWMFHTADHCIVLGEVWRNWVTGTLGVPSERVSVVHNGVPAVADAASARAETGVFRLLFLGNLQERKGVADLLAALATPQLRSRPVQVTLAGGGAVDQYRQLATELGVLDKVRFTGWVGQDEARGLITQADALILPSYDEGLPLVILEALSCGTPVICTPVGSIPEVMAHETTAWFVMPGDVTAIAEAVVRLADDPALRQHLAQEGRGLYRRLFTMDTFAREIERFYRMLTSDKPLPPKLALAPESS
ncbi:MAG: glycosyltransferase family 4 protein [Proteobacteria bacterium]|nr:glycosyltransferase family 4 protein [Pseudomonadota bacterium]